MEKLYIYYRPTQILFMMKVLFIIFSMALLLVVSIFIAGGLDHQERKMKIKEVPKYQTDIKVPLHFSKMTGLEKPDTKPFHTYISKK